MALRRTGDREEGEEDKKRQDKEMSKDKFDIMEENKGRIKRDKNKMANR